MKESSLARLENKKILVPAFICPIVPEVIRRCGFEPAKVDADLETFNVKISGEAAGAALVCHTFGARCDIPDGMPVIEDCANFYEKELEGDFGLFSLWKQLPNVRGGYIQTSEDLCIDHLGQDRLSLFEIFMKISGPHRMIFNFLRSKRELPKSCDVSSEKWDILKAPRIFTKDFKAKKDVYDRLCRDFDDLGLEEFFIKQKMPKNSQPFNFSLRVKEEGKRDELLLALRRKGVFGDRLWYNAETEGCPNASLLAKTVINLPLHSEVLPKLKNVL